MLSKLVVFSDLIHAGTGHHYVGLIDSSGNKYVLRLSGLMQPKYPTADVYDSVGHTTISEISVSDANSDQSECSLVDSGDIWGMFVDFLTEAPERVTSFVDVNFACSCTWDAAESTGTPEVVITNMQGYELADIVGTDTWPTVTGNIEIGVAEWNS